MADVFYLQVIRLYLHLNRDKRNRVLTNMKGSVFCNMSKMRKLLFMNRTTIRLFFYSLAFTLTYPARHVVTHRDVRRAIFGDQKNSNDVIATYSYNLQFTQHNPEL